MGLLRTLSTIDTQKSKLGVRLVLEVLAKLMVAENSSWEFPKVGVRLILEVHLILETRRQIFAPGHGQCKCSPWLGSIPTVTPCMWPQFLEQSSRTLSEDGRVGTLWIRGGSKV